MPKHFSIEASQRADDEPLGTLVRNEGWGVYPLWMQQKEVWMERLELLLHEHDCPFNPSQLLELGETQAYGLIAESSMPGLPLESERALSPSSERWLSASRLLGLMTFSTEGEVCRLLSSVTDVTMDTRLISDYMLKKIKSVLYDDLLCERIVAQIAIDDEHTAEALEEHGFRYGTSYGNGDSYMMHWRRSKESAPRKSS